MAYRYVIVSRMEETPCVGFSDDRGRWHQEECCVTKEEARALCSYLNGGLEPELVEELKTLLKTLNVHGFEVATI